MRIAETSPGRFFVAGGTLRSDEACYVERKADRELYEILLGGEFAYVLTSRQMGKSSLMVRIAKKLRETGSIVAIIDLTAMGQNVTPAQWYFILAERIARQLNIREEELDVIWNDRERSPLQRWVRFLEIAVEPSDRQVVIFIDEVDLVQSLPFPTDELFAAIRQFYNRRPEEPQFDQLTFCLLGVAAPSDLIRDPKMTPFNIGKRIELADFSKEEAHVLMQGLENEVSSQLRLDRVLYWTGGHPYLTQRLCQSLVARDEDHDVDTVCANVFLGHRARVQDDNLLFVRERILKARVDLPALLNLYSKVLRQKSVPDNEARPLTKEIRLSGICKAINGNLRVRNPIYAKVFDKQLIADSMPDAERRRQRAAFRRGALAAALIGTAVISIFAALAIIVVRQRNEIERQLYVSDVTLAQEAWAHHTPNQAMELLARHVPKIGQSDPRGFEWYMLWNLCASRKPLKVIDAEAEIFNATISADGKRIFASTIGGELIALNALNGVRLRSVGLKDPPAWISISSDDHLLATATDSGRLTLWNPDTLEPIASATVGGMPRRLSFAPDDQWRLTFSADNKLVIANASASVMIWQVPTFSELVSHPTGADLVRSAVISPDGSLIAFANRNTFEVWSRRFSRLIWRSAVNQSGRISFCPNSRCVAVGYYDAVDVIDLRTKHQTWSLKGDWGFCEGLEFFPDGYRLMIGGSRGSIHVWDMSTGKQLDIFGIDPSGNYPLLFAGGQRLLAAGSSRYITIWDANQAAANLHGMDEIYTLAFSPDGNKLISGGNDGHLLVWDQATRSLQRSIYIGERIEHLAFLSSTRVLVNSVHQLAIWDISTGDKVSTLAASTGQLIAAVPSNLKTIAVTDSAAKQMEIISSATGTVLDHRPISIFTNSAAISPDGTAVAVSGDSNEALLWDRNESLQHLHGCPQASHALVFSPDGRFLLEGCDGNGDIYVWDRQSGKERITLRGHRDSIKSLVYSPDGRRLVSTSDDGSLRIWDSKTFEPLLAQDESGLGIETAAFSPDGRYLAAAGDDHGIRLWYGGDK